MIEFTYQLVLLTLSSTCLPPLDESPSPSPATYAILSLLTLRGLFLVLLHLSTPSTASFYRGRYRLRLSLRVISAGAACVGAGMLDWEGVFGWTGDWYDLLTAVIIITEMFVVFLQGTMVLCIAIIVGWNKVKVLAPFVEVDQDHVKPQLCVMELLNSIPPLIYDASMSFDSTCVICITDFEVGDQLRVLTCQHAFHVDCFDEWLRWRQVCPLCVAGVDLPFEKAEEIETVSGRAHL